MIISKYQQNLTLFDLYQTEFDLFTVKKPFLNLNGD